MNQTGRPLWARLATSPWVVIGVACAIALGFAMQGGGTRHTNSDSVIPFARGGNVGIAEPTASPSPKPQTLASGPGSSVSTTVHPTPAARATTRPSPKPTHPKPTPRPSDETQVEPTVGVYPLSVKGSESISYGAFGGCANEFPDTTSLVVTNAVGEQGGSYNFDVRYYPSRPEKHDERHIYSYSGSSVSLTFVQRVVTCGGSKSTSAISFTPAQLRVPSKVMVGSKWHTKGGDSERTEEADFSVTGVDEINEGATPYGVYVIQAHITVSGVSAGTRDQTWYYSPDLAMALRWTEKSKVSRDGATYVNDIAAEVTGLPDGAAKATSPRVGPHIAS